MWQNLQNTKIIPNFATGFEHTNYQPKKTKPAHYGREIHYCEEYQTYA